jgi:hypothetical protein
VSHTTVCHRCQKPIVGKVVYRVVGGPLKPFHPACAAEPPRHHAVVVH